MRDCDERHVHMEVHGFGCVWIVLSCTVIGAAVIADAALTLVGWLLR